MAENIHMLGVNALLGSDGDSVCEQIVATGLFSSLESYEVNLILSANNSAMIGLIASALASIR